MYIRRFTLLFSLFLTINSNAQISADSIDYVITSPDFNAELSIGFNYDFLISPLKVNFDYPRGYFGINIPLKYGLDKNLTEEYTKDITKEFKDADEFNPQASAKQNANTTIKVDVPMFGGVGSFSYMQMMSFRYGNTLGMPELVIGTKDTSSEVSLFLRGIISVPIELALGWETMSFGYAYEVNRNIAFAVNLHRHAFNFDIRGKVDLDILGYFELKLQGKPEEIGYSLHNDILGHYDAEQWTPTFALRLWRVNLISRLGMDIEPEGNMKAVYSVPFFVDPETFQVDEGLEGEQYLLDNMDKFLANATTTVEYNTNKSLRWKMPHAHTVLFDIIPEKLSFSYSKFFGDLEMELYDTEADKLAEKDSTNYPDTLDFRFKTHIDHMLLLHGSFFSSYFTVGVYSMDFSFRDKKNLLSSIEAMQSLKFGNGILTPVLTGGACIGSKLQLVIELDILPLTAVKSGIVYYF